jgi:hypothetical protein
MTDPIRHALVSFKTKDEAEQFKQHLNLTFGEYAFTDVEIERCTGKGINPEGDFKMLRHEVIVYNRRLRLSWRVIAFVIGWVAARSYTDLQEAIMLMDMEPHALYLYR